MHNKPSGSSVAFPAAFIVSMLVFSLSISQPGTPAKGPLRPHHTNPRYFVDPSGRVIYLTGSHTWANLQDLGKTDPPAQFDSNSYINFLDDNGHTFIRLWRWELTTCDVGTGLFYATPHPWERTGPGNALDGKPKFDLSRFNQSYFDRLRSRVMAAGERGIYISIMLFEGWGLHASNAPWCWNGHPFNANNNVNGIDGDTDGDGRGIEIQMLKIPQVTSIQEAYVKKVIDTVNDLDNVLYEIVNESGGYSTEWQYHFITFIKQYEASLPKQHPVGMTFQYHRDTAIRGSNETLFSSPADWISPNPDGGWRDDPPDSTGAKVVLNDTDHLWGIGGNRAWVWKSFCRGLNPLFMDRYGYVTTTQDGSKPQWIDYIDQKPADDPEFNTVRRNLGYTLTFSRRMNLGVSVPRPELSSTGYCLADRGVKYLVYAPLSGDFNVDLTGSRGAFNAEWFNPEAGVSTSGETVTGGSVRSFRAPFQGDSVLFLETKDASMIPLKPYIVLERSGIRAVIVNNDPVDDTVLPGHRAGYSGMASLSCSTSDGNLFVPSYAGLNFEHSHDGTTQERSILFEPRNAPISIRNMDKYTVELYQPPTPHWKLESVLTYKLLEDGAIEMTLECTPRARTFKNGYIGLFFASYIYQPESLDIHFMGYPSGKTGGAPEWLQGVTPEHGVRATHRAPGDDRKFAHDGDFPLSLVFNNSDYRHAEPWYYGVSHGMAYVMVFREKDGVRLTQSPSGGGKGNPAWDFQWFIPGYEVGKTYNFVMRYVLIPYETPEKVAELARRHMKVLNTQ